MRRMFLSLLFAIMVLPTAFAAAPVNPRSANDNQSVGVRQGSDATQNTRSSNTTTARTATTNVARTGIAARVATTNTARTATTQNVVRSGIIPTMAVRSATMPNVINVNRAAVPTQSVRAALPQNGARGAHTAPATTQSRSATNARAAAINMVRAPTAMFTDTSKLGTGYNQCRDAYDTCMDQFCNDNTYRRCGCSDQVTDLATKMDNLNKATMALNTFNDTVVASVGLSAAEANATVTATAGENAIMSSDDLDAASQQLSNIADILAGKAPADDSDSLTSKLIDTSDLTNINPFATSINNVLSSIWDGTDAGTAATDVSNLTGAALFNSVNSQCTTLVGEQCGNNANTLVMVRSAYSTLISQDCNAYQKTVIDAQTSAFNDNLRIVQNNLRDARLAEYKSHNSADMNACIAAVRDAMTSDSACGADWVRCLDVTGTYLDQSGNPIMGPNFFKLADQITLSDNPMNSNLNAPGTMAYVNVLNTYRDRAQTALDTCSDIADDVWNAFLQQAIIEIANAQGQKVQQVKDSCVQTVADCYGTQIDQMNAMDEDTAVSSGAIAAQAASTMCQQNVDSCAAMFSDGCATNTNVAGTGDADSCGRDALLAFVQIVDSNRANAACKDALTQYMESDDGCGGDDTGDSKYYKCRLDTPAQIMDMITTRAATYCQDVADSSNLMDGAQQIINDLYNTVLQDIRNVLAQTCATDFGIWDPTATPSTDADDWTPGFLSDVWGGKIVRDADGTNDNWGMCSPMADKTECDTAGGEYDTRTQACTLPDSWFRDRCENYLGGTWGGSTCDIVTGSL